MDYAGIHEGKSVAVYGSGPVGQFCTRIACYRGAERVFGVELVPERLEMARRHGVEVLNLQEHGDIVAAIRELTDGRGPDSVIDAVGMEAHGAPAGGLAQHITGLLPDQVSPLP